MLLYLASKPNPAQTVDKATSVQFSDALEKRAIVVTALEENLCLYVFRLNGRFVYILSIQPTIVCDEPENKAAPFFFLLNVYPSCRTRSVRKMECLNTI